MQEEGMSNKFQPSVRIFNTYTVILIYTYTCVTTVKRANIPSTESEGSISLRTQPMETVVTKWIIGAGKIISEP